MTDDVIAEITDKLIYTMRKKVVGAEAALAEMREYWALRKAEEPKPTTLTKMELLRRELKYYRKQKQELEEWIAKDTIDYYENPSNWGGNLEDHLEFPRRRINICDSIITVIIEGIQNGRRV